jgi:hypothetical protein
MRQASSIDRLYKALILFALLLSPPFLQAQEGFLGKRHQIGIDLFNAAYQQLFEVEHRYTFDNERWGIGVHVGYFYAPRWVIRTIELEEPDPKYGFGSTNAERSLLQGPSLGFEIGGSMRGLPYPLGHSLAFGIRGTLLKIDDHYEELEDPLSYRSGSLSFYFRFSRFYRLTRDWRIGLQLAGGVRGYWVYPERSKENRELLNDFGSPGPSMVAPARYPIFFGRGKGGSAPWFLKPSVELAYQF